MVMVANPIMIGSKLTYMCLKNILCIKRKVQIGSWSNKRIL